MIKNLKKISESELIELMHGSKLQSDAAFNEIYERCKTSVYKYCKYMLSNKSDVDDVFQETFTRFYKKVMVDGHRGKILNYLIVIAGNLCRNHNRDHKSFVPVDINDFISDERNNYEKKELFELIKTSLELVETSHREVFILREFDGLPYSEIAEICDISITAAKSRVARTKQKIITILQPYIKELEF